eukprot:352764-Chlamydomonas_euryale.AAC.5
MITAAQPCKSEMNEQGSCKLGVSCEFSHNPKDIPEAKTVEKDIDMGRSNLHWLYMGSKAFKNKISASMAKKLKSWDELRGICSAKGVQIIRGSLGTYEHGDRPKPGYVRMTGPVGAVSEIQEMLQEQKKILGKLPRYTVAWNVADDPWVYGLFADASTNKKINKLLETVADSQNAWYEMEHCDAGPPHANGINVSKATSSFASAMASNVLVLAKGYIGVTDCFVGYAGNVADLSVDAIITSCGPYMAMRDGVAADIVRKFPQLEQAATAPTGQRMVLFGPGPIPDCQVGMCVQFRVAMFGARKQLHSAHDHVYGNKHVVPLSVPNTEILCSYLPVATSDATQNEAWLTETIKNAIMHIAKHNQNAALRKIRTAALPLLGTGRFGYKREDAAKWIMAALSETMPQAHQAGLEAVFLVDKYPPAINAWKESLKGVSAAFETHQELPVKLKKRPGWCVRIGIL